MKIDKNTIVLSNTIMKMIILGYSRKHIVRSIARLSILDTEKGFKWKRRKMKAYLRELHWHCLQMVKTSEGC